MDELFNDEYKAYGDAGADDDDDDEGFVYTGVDAPDIPAGYTDQLREVLGSELTDDEMDAPDLKLSSIHEEDHEPGNKSLAHDDEEASSKDTSSPSLASITPVHMTPSGSSTFKVSRPFPPPGVSRLRSYTPQTLRSISNGSAGSRLTSNSHPPEGISPSPSHFSSVSRSSSRSDIYLADGPTSPTFQNKYTTL
ncbi:hypothetical protein E4T56_gene10449 [Termitomyces sp. T112]|nr:hypothetical protein E4T56_gene10449 [Termitomyces sp. T112]